MNDVTKRFIEFYEQLKNEGAVKNAKAFALSIGASQSFISELRNNRSNVGVSAIQNTVLTYHMNPVWLFVGRGRKKYNPKSDSKNMPESSVYKAMLKEKENELKEAYKEIGKLESLINELQNNTNKERAAG